LAGTVRHTYKKLAPPKVSGTQSLTGAAKGSPLIRLAYSLVRDSGGGHPNPGAEVDLLFATRGEAFLYLADAKEALGEAGTYSYSGGRLSLHIVSSDFNANATFPLSLTAGQVKMPFKVFSSGKGTSLWDRETPDLETGIMAVYNAAMNPSTSSVSPTQATNQAFAYAQAWLGSPSPGQLVAYTTGARRGLQPALHARVGQCTEEGGDCITGVQDLGTDIQISYSDSPPVVVTLWSFSPSPNAPAELTVNSLAGDPRIYLDPEVHQDSEFDPMNRTAVLIDPTYTSAEPGPIFRNASTLQKHHYRVTVLAGKKATVEAIAAALSKSPGLVIFSTHGNNKGQLMTESVLNAKSTKNKYGHRVASKDAYEKYDAQLKSEGLASLAAYKGPGSAKAYILEVPDCTLLAFRLPTECTFIVGITPYFWTWLADARHVNFDDSLVVITACFTDEYPVLRDAIKAKSYFAYHDAVAGDFSDAVEEYLVDFLTHATRSPEEAYYNLVRIDRTRQIIYKEDRLLNGVLGTNGGSASVGILDAWGWNGSAWVDYRTSGWLSDYVDQAQVWWLLFAGRWDRDAFDGAMALKGCYTNYWSQGKTATIAAPFCNAANAGLPADTGRVERDVDYAIYLLRGTKPSGIPPGSLPPRWTLDD
jgi:hypothetical protein